MMKEKKKINVIYKAQNKLTGEVYIGATKNSIHQRKLDHQERANRGEKGQFQEAIGTYGPDAFTWTQIDTASTTDELAQKEKEYIIRYDSRTNGLNSDSGGGIQKTIYQYSIEDGSLIAKYDCLESAANAVSAAKTSISNACLGQNKTCKSYYWSYSYSIPMNLKDKRRKTVIKMALDGRILSEYKSVAEASRKTGVSKSCIARFCRGDRKPSEGYRWQYE
ncbi:NUMOD1 domain-containing DNA-binding protein [Thalassobellus suaedae]|uniref:NUMOD1 domain-containing DNA-binding protein n=1 Tax=Thalassobellus suaedae TaxID=3074124 RepID=A0ABY9Y7M4_9FLAO|nr:NUMOD1 domain-containing DNA-binding protein [Flavobacteriaceae bacterium HL-DH10]